MANLINQTNGSKAWFIMKKKHKIFNYSPLVLSAAAPLIVEVNCTLLLRVTHAESVRRPCLFHLLYIYSLYY